MNYHPNVEAAASTKVSPELVARKLAAISNFEYPGILLDIESNPRIPELLWFIQGMSLQPGGLKRFAQQVLEAFPQRLGTDGMRAASESSSYTLREQVEIWKELPDQHRPTVLPPEDSSAGSAYDNILWNMAISQDEEIDKLLHSHPALLSKALAELDKEQMIRRCRNAALADLPFVLAALCVEDDVGFSQWKAKWGPNEPNTIAGRVWYFDRIIETLMEFMDRHASEAQNRIADTEVSRQTFERLDYAYESRSMILIRGDSRYGKTQALKTWCQMWPGRGRLVTVPGYDSVREFFRAIADALGMDTTYTANVQTLRGRVGDVLKQSRFFLVFDEAAFLVPQKFSRNTAPHRLNWVRTELFDRGLAVAIAVTPQWYDGQNGALTKFVRKTSYTIEQFMGRCQQFTLPDALSQEDLERVVIFHLPEVRTPSLRIEIAGRAAGSDNYLQSIENLSKRARFMAKSRGLPLTEDLVRRVLEDMFPDPRAHRKEAVQAVCTDSEAELQAPCRGDAVLESNRLFPTQTGRSARSRTAQPVGGVPA